MNNLKNFDLNFKLNDNKYYPSCRIYPSFIDYYVRHCWNIGSGANSKLGRKFGSEDEESDEMYTRMKNYVKLEILIPYNNSYKTMTWIEKDIFNLNFGKYFSTLCSIVLKYENHTYVISKPYFISQDFYKSPKKFSQYKKEWISNTKFVDREYLILISKKLTTGIVVIIDGVLSTITCFKDSKLIKDCSKYYQEQELLSRSSLLIKFIQFCETIKDKECLKNVIVACDCAGKYDRKAFYQMFEDMLNELDLDLKPTLVKYCKDGLNVVFKGINLYLNDITNSF